MHHIVYSSTASFPFTDAELQQMLVSWRAKNNHLGITGVLLYSEGSIMQVLEGEAAPVQKLYATIAADMRHRSVVCLADGPVAERIFTDWLMQYRAVEPADFTRLLLLLEAVQTQASSLAPLIEGFI